jgi:hypothetical protein
VSTEAEKWETWLHLFLTSVYTLSPVKKTGRLLESGYEKRPQMSGLWFVRITRIHSNHGLSLDLWGFSFPQIVPTALTTSQLRAAVEKTNTT